MFLMHLCHPTGQHISPGLKLRPQQQPCEWMGHWPCVLLYEMLCELSFRFVRWLCLIQLAVHVSYVSTPSMCVHTQDASKEQFLHAALHANSSARAAGISAAADAMALKTKDAFGRVGNVLGSSFAKFKQGIP